MLTFTELWLRNDEPVLNTLIEINYQPTPVTNMWFQPGYMFHKNPLKTSTSIQHSEEVPLQISLKAFDWLGKKASQFPAKTISLFAEDGLILASDYFYADDQ